MSKLLSRSKTYLVSALFNLNRTDDISALDAACFLLQQSLEFSIKYIYECEGLTYDYTHSITNLISKLESNASILPELAVFKDKADVYTKWEAESRYLDSFYAAYQDAKECAERLKKLHEAIECNFANKAEVSDDIINWCKENAPDAMKDLPLEELLTYMMPLYDTYGKN